MDKKYFGQGCEYLSAQWESGDDELEDYKNKINPILVFCNHKENKDQYEGNCNKNQCPLVKDKP